MFVRTSTRKNADGTRVSYLQLVHNEWDAAAKTTRAKLLYSFGRTDQLDRPAIERLITALTRVLGTEPAAGGSGPDRARPVGLPGLAFVESRPLGGAWLLDQLWHRLGIDTLLRGLAGRTRRDPVVERVLFALVANRALAPCSKLAATSWVAHDVHLPGLTGSGHRVSDDACYRAMDWLIAVEDRLARGVFDAVAHLLNLEVDLIFFDTTSTYFETESADEPVWRDERGRVLNGGTDGGTDGEVAPEGAAGKVGFRIARQVQGLPRRPPAGGGRDGRHPGRDPGAGVVLAGQHLRFAADPPGQGRAAGLDPGPGDLGRRPRVHLRGQPAPPRRRRGRLHPRGEAALRLARGHRRPVPPRPLPAGRARTCGSRRSRSASTSGSWSATTPTRPSATPPPANGSSPGWRR